MAKLELHGLTLDLEPGESWDDRISLDLSREEATAILAVLMHELDQNREGLRAATDASLRGEPGALLVALALTESQNMLQAVLVKVTGIVKPDLVKEATREMLKERLAERENDAEAR